MYFDGQCQVDHESPSVNQGFPVLGAHEVWKMRYLD